MLDRRHGIAPRFLLLALALVGACEDTPAVSEEVGDFSEISEAAPTIEPSSDGTSAVMTVVTTIEAVCAVAYGDTDSMGGAWRPTRRWESAATPSTRLY